MDFIEQIFKGKVDEKTHQKFIKYGRGEFPGPVLEIKKQVKDIKVKGSFDYADILGKLIAENTRIVFDVSGNIISKNNLEGDLSGLNVKIQKTSKKGKLKVYQIKTGIDSEILKKLYELDAYVLLSLTPEEKSILKLKSKSSLPKPGEAIDPAFCSATFDVSMLDKVMGELCFDVDARNFKSINISHKYIIGEVIIPEEFKDDPAKIRIHAKRKGKIIRSITVDDEEIVKEGSLLA
jgi:hypothetical protein